MNKNKNKNKNKKKYFITGTDTDVGKTLVTCGLIKAFQQKNMTVVGIKPIAAGCELIDGQLRNSDALSIIQAMDHHLAYEMINPVTLRSPIAPHIAASQEEIYLSVKGLQELCNLAQFNQDYLLIEGAGGWLVPLNDEETFADFVVAESLEVILVVGMKLGCINHALLTVENIESKGLLLAGWVANCLDKDMNVLEDNIQTLCERINAPILGTIPYLVERESLAENSRTNQASTYVNIAPLL